MTEYRFTTYRKMRLWINEMLIHNIEPEKSLSQSFILPDTTEICLPKKSIILEMFFPRNCSYYGLLGVKYFTNNSNQVNVKVNIGNRNNKKYINSLSYNDNELIVGLTEEYAPAVLEKALLKIEELKIAGSFEFDIAVCDNVGSSIMVFRIITGMLMELIANDKFILSEENINLLIRNETQKSQYNTCK